MRRIKATAYAIVAVIIVLFIMAEAGNIGVPWQFSLVAIVIVGMIIVSLIRAWLRG